MIATAERNKVLIIDDEFGPRESLRFLLKDEYDVVTADNVDAGMKTLQEEHPDLVIMDIRMPGKTGIQGLRELRQLDPHTSVIMLTGFGALETAQEALRLGANDYINKPFDTREMKELVGRFTLKSRVERKRLRMLRELQDMNSRLVEDIASKERLATIGQTSAEFAHDLRNPLMIVQGYVSLLTQQLEKVRDLMGSEFDQTSDYLGVIENNLHRCVELASMWQNMDQADINSFKPMSLKQLLEDLELNVEPLTSVVDVELEYRINDASAQVRGCRAQLVRAIYNVIANAVDAVEAGVGKITIACDVREHTAELTVTDNGSGMPKDVLDRMFEPYFTTKPKGKGTGLGTAIARRILEEHGGSIDVASEPGRGTTVNILLPILHDADASDADA